MRALSLAFLLMVSATLAGQGLRTFQVLASHAFGVILELLENPTQIVNYFINLNCFVWLAIMIKTHRELGVGKCDEKFKDPSSL